MAVLAKLVLWAVAAALCSIVVRLLLVLDLNKATYSHTPGPCQLVDGIDHGAEDIELLDDGLALISSGLIYMNTADREHTRGRIFMYNMDDAVRLFTAKQLHIVVPAGHSFDKATFTPHGISSYTSKGRTQLYVINHEANGQDAVEVFRFDKDKRTLTHEKTIRHEMIYSANDLVVTGADRFIIINDHYFKNAILRTIEDVLQMKWGNVLFYDGKSAKVIESKLPMPVGLAVSKDMDYLYVSLAQSESIAVYRLARDFTATRHTEISLLTAPDNIYVHNDTGNLWVGCHPVAHQALWHLLNPTQNSAPSQALRIRMQDGHKSWVLTEPFADDGDNLQGSSVAVAYKDSMLIGTVHHRLMHCQILNDELA